MAELSICTIDGCNKPARKRGWCGAHYIRWQRHGDPTGGAPQRARNRGACSVGGCSSPAITRGYCGTHYARVLRTGKEEVSGTPRGEPMQFLDDVVMAHEGDNCLIWPYSRNSEGYGTVWDGEKMDRVHRIVCTRLYGPAPFSGHEGAHSCGRGHEACVSPHHVRWDTRAGNFADKIAHGTHNRGERNDQHKLTEADVRQIRALKGRQTQAEIAATFGVTKSNVSAIHRRASWGWLE